MPPPNSRPQRGPTKCSAVKLHGRLKRQQYGRSAGSSLFDPFRVGVILLPLPGATLRGPGLQCLTALRSVCAGRFSIKTTCGAQTVRTMETTELRYNPGLGGLTGVSHGCAPVSFSFLLNMRPPQTAYSVWPSGPPKAMSVGYRPLFGDEIMKLTRPGWSHTWTPNPVATKSQPDFATHIPSLRGRISTDAAGE